jgi:hypothetical protein
VTAQVRGATGAVLTVRVDAVAEASVTDLYDNDVFLEHAGKRSLLMRETFGPRTRIGGLADDFFGDDPSGDWTLVAVPRSGRPAARLSGFTVTVVTR